MSDDELDGTMTLAPGYGVVPEHQRNRGYDKLDFGAGEGGLAADIPVGGGEALKPFLNAVAAGADPQKLAQEMTGTPKRAPRGSR